MQCLYIVFDAFRFDVILWNIKLLIILLDIIDIIETDLDRNVIPSKKKSLFPREYQD